MAASDDRWSVDAKSVTSLDSVASGGRANGLTLKGPPFGLEDVNDYEAGGHRPVHLGDCLCEERYRVIHKLGNGGFANVWVRRDLMERKPPTYKEWPRSTVTASAMGVSLLSPSCNSCPNDQ
jgi:hypothetical protein